MATREEMIAELVRTANIIIDIQKYDLTDPIKDYKDLCSMIYCDSLGRRKQEIDKNIDFGMDFVNTIKERVGI